MLTEESKANLHNLWLKVRPEVKEIIYLIIGVLLGYMVTIHSNKETENNRRRELVSAALYEIELNTMSSWYPMYFDSIKYATEGIPYPLISNDLLRTLTSSLLFLEQTIKSDSLRNALKASVTYANMEIAEFNMRIEIRNQLIYSYALTPTAGASFLNTIVSNHNARAYSAYQTHVKPALINLEKELVKLQ